MALLPSLGSEYVNVAMDPAPPVGRTIGLPSTRSAQGRQGPIVEVGGNKDEAATVFTVVTPNDGPDAVPSLMTSKAVESKINVGEDWFEKIHIYPGGDIENPTYDQTFKLEFGNILAQSDLPYRMHNAFRKNNATLTSIIKTAVSPGIETPEIIATDQMNALTEFLAPASTFNVDLITGLGTPAFIDLRVLQDGLSRFDGPVTFNWDLQATFLNTSGSRVSIITSNYDFPYSETLEFLTDIIPSTSGTEQRISVRKQPRETFNCIFRLDGIERQRMQALIFDWHSEIFGLPLYHEGVQMSTSSLVGANQFQITGGDATEFRVGALGLVIIDAFTFDIVTISAITDTLLSITGTAVFAYPAGTRVVPVRTCRISKPVRTTITKVGNLEEFSIAFESTDNDTGTSPGSTTAWNSATYNGKIFLDECNLQGNKMATQLQRNIIVLDNATGKVSSQSSWGNDKRLSSRGFLAQSKQEIQDLKALLRAVRGRQVSFYMMTDTYDLTVADDLNISSTVLDIENIDYARFVRDREPMATFRITFTDDTTLTRTITGSADHPTDVTLERLTIDSGWAANRTVAEIKHIQFYELVRFNTDMFRISYDRVGRARMKAPVIVVFD